MPAVLDDRVSMTALPACAACYFFSWSGRVCAWMCVCACVCVCALPTSSSERRVWKRGRQRRETAAHERIRCSGAPGVGARAPSATLRTRLLGSCRKIGYKTASLGVGSHLEGTTRAQRRSTDSRRSARAGHDRQDRRAGGRGRVSERGERAICAPAQRESRRDDGHQDSPREIKPLRS